MNDIFSKTAKILIDRIKDKESEKASKEKEAMELSYSRDRILLNTNDDMIILAPIKDTNDLDEMINYMATFNIMLKTINNDIEENQKKDRIDIIIDERHRIKKEVEDLSVLFLKTLLKGYLDE